MHKTPAEQEPDFYGLYSSGFKDYYRLSPVDIHDSAAYHGRLHMPNRVIETPIGLH